MEDEEHGVEVLVNVESKPLSCLLFCTDLLGTDDVGQDPCFIRSLDSGFCPRTEAESGVELGARETPPEDVSLKMDLLWTVACKTGSTGEDDNSSALRGVSGRKPFTSSVPLLEDSSQEPGGRSGPEI